MDNQDLTNLTPSLSKHPIHPINHVQKIMSKNCGLVVQELLDEETLLGWGCACSSSGLKNIYMHPIVKV